MGHGIVLDEKMKKYLSIVPLYCICEQLVTCSLIREALHPILSFPFRPPGRPTDRLSNLMMIHQGRNLYGESPHRKRLSLSAAEMISISASEDVSGRVDYWLNFILQCVLDIRMIKTNYRAKQQKSCAPLHSSPSLKEV